MLKPTNYLFSVIWVSRACMILFLLHIDRVVEYACGYHYAYYQWCFATLQKFEPDDYRNSRFLVGQKLVRQISLFYYYHYVWDCFQHFLDSLKLLLVLLWKCCLSHTVFGMEIWAKLTNGSGFFKTFNVFRLSQLTWLLLGVVCLITFCVILVILSQHD